MMFEPKGSLEERMDKLEKDSEKVQDYIRRLRESMQEESAERIEDFDWLEMSNKPWVDVREYGASPSLVDNIMAFTAASTALGVAGGILYVPRGTYKFLSTLTLARNVSLIGEGMGVTILDFSGAADNGITSMGIATELANLDANITKASRTVTLDGTPVVSEEDLILIYDATTYSFSGYRDYYRAGEFGVVDNINGNDINLTTATYAAYTDDADMHVYKITPTTMVLQDFSIQGAGAGSYVGVKITYGRNCVMKRVESYDWQRAALEFNLCYDCAAHNVNGRSVVNASPIGLDYGIHLTSCQDMSITDSFFMADRHAIAVGSGGAGPHPPCRNILLQGCHAWNTSRHAVSAIDVHGHGEYAIIDSCITDSIIVAGNHCKVTNNTIYAEAFDALRIREPLGFDFEFKNNTVYMEGDRYFLYAAIDSDTTIGGTFIFKNNTCYMNFGTSGDEIPVAIYNAGSTQADLQVEMCGNMISNRSGTEHSSVNIQVTSGNYFESIKFNDNTLDGYSLKLHTTQALEMCNNQIKSGGDDLGVSITSTAPAASPSIYKISDNTITGCEGNGLAVIAGSSGNPCLELVVTGNIIKDNATSAGTRYELYLKRATHCVVRDNLISGSSAELNDLVTFENMTTIEVWNNIFVTTLVDAWAFTSIGTYRGQIIDNIADDGEVVLPDTAAGWLRVWGGGEMMIVQTTSQAACTSLLGSANTAVTDSDGDLCVYDKGTTVGVKNALGSEQKIYIEMYS